MVLAVFWNPVGLVLKQIQVRTGLPRERTRLALRDLERDNVVASSAVADGSARENRIFVLREGLELMINHYKKKKL